MAKKPEETRSSGIWGGRFDGNRDALMIAVNASIDFDQRLYEQDIAGSEAHVRMLAAQGIVAADDAEAILGGLATIRDEIRTGKLEFSHELEDIHMNIEARLAELIGEPAGRLHTARSRNDQAATDLRLWIRDECDRLDGALADLQAALMDQAEEHADTLMPGLTHLQAAQPVTFGHHLMAYVEMLGRDRGRFADARRRLNESPLGAAALAGTSFPIDRNMTASQMGFDAPMSNSMDAVSARDFVIEYLAAASIAATHLSRLAEEIVLWSSDRFGFIRLSDAFSTGSSIMPQKRNPDAAELIRAKPGRIIGALMAMLTVIKGLPMTYCKDMQEDKEPVFDAADQIGLAVAVMTGMIGDMNVNREAMKAATMAGFSTATDLADWIVINLGLPFREAHHLTGRAVAMAEQKGIRLDELSLDDLTSIHAGFTEAAKHVLDPAAAVASRTSFGGTAPSRVREAIKAARKRFS